MRISDWSSDVCSSDLQIKLGSIPLAGLFLAKVRFEFLVFLIELLLLFERIFQLFGFLPVTNIGDGTFLPARKVQRTDIDLRILFAGLAGAFIDYPASFGIFITPRLDFGGTPFPTFSG